MSDLLTGDDWLTAGYGFAPQVNVLRGKNVGESSVALKAYTSCARTSDGRRRSERASGTTSV